MLRTTETTQQSDKMLDFSHSLLCIITWSKLEKIAKEYSNTLPTYVQPIWQTHCISFLKAQMLAEQNSETDPYVLSNSTASELAGQMCHQTGK